MGIQSVSSSTSDLAWWKTLQSTSTTSAQQAKQATQSQQTQQVAAIDSDDSSTTAQKSGGKPAGGAPKAMSGGGMAGSASSSTTSATTSTSSTTTDNKIYDKKDANKDGTVSYEEEMTYAVKHPAEASDPSSQDQLQNTQMYTQQGTLTGQSVPAYGIIDVIA